MLSSIKCVRPLLLLFLISVISACGGGKSDSGSSTNGGIQNITISDLPISLTTDENEVVHLSVNVSGEGSRDVTFDWSVRFAGEDLSFQGQGSNSITFTAPEVDGPESVSVSVDYGLRNGRLMGVTSDSVYVHVVDLDAAKTDQFSYLETTSLPRVEEIDLSGELVLSTWRLEEFYSYKTSIEGYSEDDSTVIDQRGKSVEIVYFSSQEDGVLFQQCISGNDFDIEGPALSYLAINDCETDSSVYHYQDGGELRVEARCGEQLVYAGNYTKLSDDHRENFGSVAIDFDSYTELTSTPISCGGFTLTTSSTTLDNGDSLNVASSGEFVAVTEYQGSIFMLGSEFISPNQTSFYSIDSSSGDYNSVVLWNESLPAFLSANEDVSGTLIVDTSTESRFAGSIRATIKGDIDAGEQEYFTAEFDLNLNSF